MLPSPWGQWGQAHIPCQYTKIHIQDLFGLLVSQENSKRDTLEDTENREASLGCISVKRSREHLTAP